MGQGTEATPLLGGMLPTFCSRLPSPVTALAAPSAQDLTPAPPADICPVLLRAEALERTCLVQ